MKILFAVKTIVHAKGGAERVLSEIASQLASRGHEIAVLSFDNKADGAPFYDLHVAIREIRLAEGRAEKRATMIETLKRMRLLRKTIKIEKPDVVVAFMHSMFIPVSFAIAGSGVPLIASEHIVPMHYAKRRLEFALFIVSSFMIKKITVLSDKIRQSYPAVIQKKMVVVPNPVRSAECYRIDKSTGNRTILNVGRLDPQKDQETLIRSFALLAQDYPDWDVKIVGDGELKDKLLALIGQLSLNNRVFICEPTKDIDSYYRSSDIFALPSRYESFGLATAEAMSYGLAPVGFSGCPGTNELIEHNKTGILVSDRNRVEGFKSALKSLMDDSDLRNELGDNAKNTMKGLNPVAIADVWEYLIKDTLGPIKT